MDAYKALRNKVSALIDIAKKETYQPKIDEGKNNPRTIWKLFKEFRMKNKEVENMSNFNIQLEDKVITNESDLAEVFENYFINIGSKLKEPNLNSDFDTSNKVESTK